MAELHEVAPWAATDREPEGTLSIDLIDPLTQKRLWLGTATALVRDAEDARSKVPEALRILFAK